MQLPFAIFKWFSTVSGGMIVLCVTKNQSNLPKMLQTGATERACRYMYIRNTSGVSSLLPAFKTWLRGSPLRYLSLVKATFYLLKPEGRQAQRTPLEVTTDETGVIVRYSGSKDCYPRLVNRLTAPIQTLLLSQRRD